MIRRVSTLAAALSLVLGACSTGGGIDGEGWVSLLEAIPDTPQTRQHVVLHDYTRLRSGLGLENPEADATDDDVEAYFVDLTVGPVTDVTTRPVTRFPLPAVSMESFNLGLARPGGLDIWLDEWRTAFGFSVLEVDRDAVAGLPRERLIVWDGEIDASAVREAVESDPTWSQDLREFQVAGRDHWCWTDDPEQRMIDRHDGARPFGEAGCLAAVGSGAVIRSTTRDLMTVSLGTVFEGTQSLADVEELRLVADALDRHETYAAYLAVGDTLEKLETDAAGTFLDRYEAVGLGPAFRETGEGLLIVAFVFEDEQRATANASTFRTIIETASSQGLGRPFADQLTIGEVELDGRLLTVVLESQGRAADYWIRGPLMREAFLLWQ